MCLADLELLGGFRAVDLLVVKLLKDVLEKRTGQAFGQLFFFTIQNEPGFVTWSRVFVGLRYAPASSDPSTK